MLGLQQLDSLIASLQEKACAAALTRNLRCHRGLRLLDHLDDSSATDDWTSNGSASAAFSGSTNSSFSASEPFSLYSSGYSGSGTATGSGSDWSNWSYTETQNLSATPGPRPAARAGPPAAQAPRSATAPRTAPTRRRRTAARSAARSLSPERRRIPAATAAMRSFRAAVGCRMQGGSGSSSATSTYGYSYSGSGGGRRTPRPPRRGTSERVGQRQLHGRVPRQVHVFRRRLVGERRLSQVHADTMDQSSYQYSSYQAATRYKGANSGSGSFTTTIDDNTIVSHHASVSGEDFTTTFGGSGSASTTYSGSSDADPDFWWNEAYTNSWVPADGGSDIAVTFTSDESEGQDVNLITGGVNTGLVTSGPDPYSSAINLWGASVGFAQGLPVPSPVLAPPNCAGRDRLDGMASPC